MKNYRGLDNSFRPDWQGLVDNILRRATPKRVYNLELFHDPEIIAAIADRFDLAAGLDEADEYFPQRRLIAVHRFCGFDYVPAALVGVVPQLIWRPTQDTAGLSHENGRHYVEEHAGPIRSWEDFERYTWPDPRTPSATRIFEWYQRNLPDDMCIIAEGVGHFAEWLTWLMGYESLCYALYDDRELVAAIAGKVLDLHREILRRILQFDRVKIIFPGDDMGFKTGLLMSAADTREFVLPGHKELAAMSHAAGRPYILHSCGKLDEIIDDLIDDVGIDGKHSFEDTIEDVRAVKHTYGRRTALLGGIDVDFLCRSDEAAIRSRVRETVETCSPGGGYCLGTGNSVANYIPLDNYLAMLDEGRLVGGAG